MARNFAHQVALAVQSQHIGFGALEQEFEKIRESLKKERLTKNAFQNFRDASRILLTPQPYIMGSLLTNTKGTRDTEKTLGLNTMFVSFTGHTSPDMSSISEATNEEFSPSSRMFAITPTKAIHLTKQFPISFLDGHIDERLHERAGINLNYSDASVLESLQLTLAFLYVLGPELKGRNIDMLPLLVPHRDGLLLGYIETCSEFLFLAHGSYVSRCGDSFQEVSGIMGMAHDWKAKARVYLKTYIGSNEVAKAQEAVIQKWTEITEKHIATISQISDTYIDYSGESHVDEQGWKDFKSDILQLYK
ncbi:MAG: hypothetical protein ACPGRX_03960, partial [Bdellovibrionales bacterium]